MQSKVVLANFHLPEVDIGLTEVLNFETVFFKGL
jgi:hypothetical protein